MLSLGGGEWSAWRTGHCAPDTGWAPNRSGHDFDEKIIACAENRA
jgi:hypothetical protein